MLGGGGVSGGGGGRQQTGNPSKVMGKDIYLLIICGYSGLLTKQYT